MPLPRLRQQSRRCHPVVRYPKFRPVDQDAPYHEACAREGLNESECVGRLIWFKATAGNERFHTYTFQQRIGVLVDWFRVLRADQRDDRFWAWGIINDPACCKPGDADCPAKSADETYGFDWCPGDDVLLKYVGKQATSTRPAASRMPHSTRMTRTARRQGRPARFGLRSQVRHLDRGTGHCASSPTRASTPPNGRPLNGGNASWSGFNATKAAATGIESDTRVSKLADASVEPPFLIGTSCGSCHIAFDPLNPPADPAHPKWENIKGLIGNQYTRMSELLGSGMPKSALEYQMFAHARPGVTDTSAISHDQINNPGTINALINVAQRPVFKGEVGHQVAQGGQYLRRREGRRQVLVRTRPQRQVLAEEHARDDTTTVFLGGQKVVLPGVHHILKGGEDSTGAHEAIQRVYFNIGSCSEQCWVNHFTDMRQVDPEQRGFGQTPFNVGQCRRDCPNFRAVEDRLQNILDFFASAESDETDLQARANARKTGAYTRPTSRRSRQGIRQGRRGRGQTVFADNCARCHSSIPESTGGSFKNRDFAAPNDAHPRKVRVDFLATTIDAGHRSRHLPLPLAALQPHGRPPLHGIRLRHPAQTAGGGADIPRTRRNSRTAAAATCATSRWSMSGPPRPSCTTTPSARKSAASRPTRTMISTAPATLTATASCSPAARLPALRPDGGWPLRALQAFDARTAEPQARGSKRTLTNADLIIDVGIRPLEGKTEKPLGGFGQVKIPAGRQCRFPQRPAAQAADRRPLPRQASPGATGSRRQEGPGAHPAGDGRRHPQASGPLRRHPAREARFPQCQLPDLHQEIENEGHRFGEDLSEADKKALTAFLATL
jgi:hypothetical protein